MRGQLWRFLALGMILGFVPVLRADSVDHMRVAAADRLIENDEEIAAYLAAQFNTIVLYDVENGLPKSEERIAYEISFARAHGLHVLLGKPTEVEISEGKRRARALAVPGPLSASDDEIRDRLLLWSRYGHDVVIGVFFLHDDAFLIHATVERQRHLYALAHDTVPDWSVFGIIGEFGFDATDDDVARYFDPAAFDHLFVLMYPLNIGEVTGVHLDSAAAADPDEDVRAYVRRYVTHMGEKFLSRLQPGQTAILVIQAFAYDVESIGRIPRPSDITIETAIGNAVLRSIGGQERNHSLAYFLWDGSRAGMFGLWQRPDWINRADQANRLEELRSGGGGINP
jgi:hypothetical protein